MPLRERNELLRAAGFAPAFTQRSLDELEMGPARDAIEQLLKAQEPYPALVVDRHWSMVAANQPVALLTRGVAEPLLAPPVPEESSAAGPRQPIAVPLRLRHGDAELVFISTVATFGTAADVTLAELSIESFSPADQATAAALGA